MNTTEDFMTMNGPYPLMVIFGLSPFQSSIDRIASKTRTHTNYLLIGVYISLLVKYLPHP